MAGPGDRETIKIPRPGPGQYAIIACAEDEATAWIIGSKDMLTYADVMAHVPDLLAEAQQQLRDTCPNPAG